jgi:AraC-like DNA-binding protein
MHEKFEVILRGVSQSLALEASEERLSAGTETLRRARPMCQLAHAYSGLEGVEEARKACEAGEPYQVAFVAIRMPGIDGVETIERIWAFDQQLQAVICAAYADYRWEELARRLGRTDRLLILKRPFQDIEVVQLTCALAEKWALAKRAAVRMRQTENLLRAYRKLHEHFKQTSALEPRDLVSNPVDADFLRETMEVVEARMADFEFDVDVLARQVAVSRRQLFRKFKALVGCTPNVFIRTVRLKRAAQLLKESSLTVSEVIFAVGFSDPKYFRAVFRGQFGVAPGEYAKQFRGSNSA